jgi:hypothetical protein
MGGPPNTIGVCTVNGNNSYIRKLTDALNNYQAGEQNAVDALRKKQV